MKSAEAPEVFNNPDAVIIGPGKRIRSVDVPIAPDGAYNGNGQFKNAEGLIFKIKGFDKTQGEGIDWFGQGYIAEEK